MKNRLRKPRLSHSSLFTKKNKTMYTDRQIASLVVCLQRPEAAEADLTLLSKKCPSIDVAAYRISPRRNQASILRHLLTVCTRDEIEKNRTSVLKNADRGKTPPVLGASASSPNQPAKSSPAKKKPKPKKKSTPASAGKTSTTATPSSQPSSTTTE